jgi:hypothetical protein
MRRYGRWQLELVHGGLGTQNARRRRVEGMYGCDGETGSGRPTTGEAIHDGKTRSVHRRRVAEMKTGGKVAQWSRSLR